MAEAKNLKTQLVVVGAGPGGYAAAFHAADKGMEVVLVNASKRLGGVCLHTGCIPSKALLHLSKLIHEAKEAGAWGVHFPEPKINIDQVREWKNRVVGQLAGGIDQLAKQRKVKVINAYARFRDDKTLELEQVEGGPKDIPETLEYEYAILASGSRPAIPGPLRVDDERVMDSTAALELKDIPGKLLVVGGGYIGLEMGTFYAALGSKVTVVEMTSGLLPGVDRDMVKPLHQRLEKQFHSIHVNSRVEQLKPTKRGIEAHFTGEADKGKQYFDRVLISAGRLPNSEDLGLENTKARIDEKGFVKVYDNLQTDEKTIYAIGDVAGEPMLAHKATREAKVAVESILGEKAVFDNVAIPAVVFTDPEVAWCGITEEQAKAEGRTVKTAKFPWGASGRALTLDRTEGFTKLIFDPKTDRLLGVCMVGTGAGELIAEGVLAVEMAAVGRDITDSIHAHPTLSETVMEAAELYYGEATHIKR